MKDAPRPGSVELTDVRDRISTGIRLSFLPPLMVYFAAGVSGLTTLVGTFVVKEHLALSAHFLATLGFWIALPLALKIPTGHLVDLLWRFKSLLIFVGAGLVAGSLIIMMGLLSDRVGMGAIMPLGTWYVISALLGPTGYMLQDAVADAMTVEAVPRFNDDGSMVTDDERTQMHTKVQMLGRVALISGNIIIGVLNIAVFSGVGGMSTDEKTTTYMHIYQMALAIPVVSVIGVILAAGVRARRLRKLILSGFDAKAADALISVPIEQPPVNWVILGGGIAFTVVAVSLGVFGIPAAQEWVFILSFVIVGWLMLKLLRDLSTDARRGIIGTALVIFVFRAMPGPGVGPTWWSIDVLHFDQQFLAVLDLTSSVITIAALFLLRKVVARRPVVYVVGILTVLITLLTLPNLALYYGIHNWTAAKTGGIVDARFIALIDGALESPLMQIVWVPMLAWIAKSAPDNLKATYFAVMTTFINLARSAGQLGTKYLNEVFTVTREVRDSATGAVLTPQDYSQVGHLLIATIALGVTAPIVAVIVLRFTRTRTI